MKRVLTYCAFIIVCAQLPAQQTIGLFLNDAGSFEGYTLFAPTSYNHTYLIDNCGKLVRSWESNFLPGHAAYLLENGDLLRTARITSSFNGGGSGGRIERFSWEGDLEWSYDYSTPEYHQHHDIEPLPNGNILILAWIRKTHEEAIAAGRDPSTVFANGLWSEHIVEIKPLSMGDAAVLWEWHAWDHLVQDFDSTLSNYGAPADYPGRIDINRTGDGSLVDWLHCNSIDYHPDLDQIMLSCRNFNELWIIDHSTTTGEAAGDTGGTAGRGGELLYRWGNPATYHHGTEEEQIFYGQHDAHWIPEGLPDAGKIMVFNNGPGRPEGNYSSIDVIIPPLLSDNSYAYIPGVAYGPDSLFWTYDGSPSQTFFSLRVSGASQLPNGNTLICDGSHGIFLEVDTNGTLVWEYRNPVGPTGPLVQGTISGVSDVFRVYRYGPDYPAFDGRDMTPGAPVELEPTATECTTVSTRDHTQEIEQAVLSPNPSTDYVTLTTPGNEKIDVRCYSTHGELVHQSQGYTGGEEISTKDWHAGMYIVYISAPNHQWHIVRKLIVL